MSLNRANRLLSEGRHSAALFEYSQLATSGIEPAQFNAAFLLSQQSRSSCPQVAGGLVSGDKQEHRLLAKPAQNKVEAAPEELAKNNTLSSNKAAYLSLSEHQIYTGMDACEVRALLLFGLSAAQNNVEALLHMGDFHYYGRAMLPANKAEVKALCVSCKIFTEK